ncbi:hypothetical protein J2X68_007198 [Streptomyces sp. 3330]|nr:hypothetical protein [Streptomyces sp. 3330]MDR6980458.1 hypothetical protein [Streptomyces sp. 3330]
MALLTELRRASRAPSRARAGVALGTTAVVLSLVVFGWEIWVLEQASQ